MTEISRKRQLDENKTVDFSKHLKTSDSMKENIPPGCTDASILSDDVYLQDIKATPKKSRENLKEQPVTPSTNVKLLAALAADLEYVKCATPKSRRNGEVSDEVFSELESFDVSASKVNRKEKSLAIICSRFLAMYPTHPPPNEKITVSLDEVCVKLGVERRRLYDIVNVFESIDIVCKNAKNQYLWFGKNNLHKALLKIKTAAVKENILEKLEYVLKTDSENCKQSCNILSEVQNFNKTIDGPDSPIFSPQTPSSDLRREKSLGILSQKFLMLFLVSPDKIISLGVAAKVLNGFLQRNERTAQIKTQIRRLYDVANVLTSIGLIQKENLINYGRKPAFKYIGPDLQNVKGETCNIDAAKSSSKIGGKKNFTRHSSFQEICAVAEIEHQKLNLKESHNSAPPFEYAIKGEKEKNKTNFENLKLNSDTNGKVPNTDVREEKSKVKTPLLIQPNLKFVNLKQHTTNPTAPCYILNSLPANKSEVKFTNTYGTQTFLLINTLPTSKELKTKLPENPPVNKVSNQQTITLSPQQRDAILQSLNISLSSQQIAAIHLDGASQANNTETPCNVLKIMNKTSLCKESEDINCVKSSLQKDVEQSINTRSNTPNSTQTIDSPISIPSGYATPIPNVTSDISFISNTEVQEILKNIENQSNHETASNKTNISKSEFMNVHTINSKPENKSSVNDASSLHTIIMGKKLENDTTSLNSNSNSEITSITNQVSQLISNDSCSNDSANLEVKNILKSKSLGDASVKSKPFLIDENSILSPIKTPKTPTQILVPSSLISPSNTLHKTVFVFSSPSTSFQTTKILENSNIKIIAPNLLTEMHKNNMQLNFK